MGCEVVWAPRVKREDYRRRCVIWAAGGIVETLVLSNPLFTMATCSLCPGRTFRTVEALHQHKIDSKTHFYCQACMQDAPDAVALVEVRHYGHSVFSTLR